MIRLLFVLFIIGVLFLTHIFFDLSTLYFTLLSISTILIAAITAKGQKDKHNTNFLHIYIGSLDDLPPGNVEVVDEFIVYNETTYFDIIMSAMELKEKGVPMLFCSRGPETIEIIKRLVNYFTHERVKLYIVTKYKSTSFKKAFTGDYNWIDQFK